LRSVDQHDAGTLQWIGRGVGDEARELLRAIRHADREEHDLAVGGGHPIRIAREDVRGLRETTDSVRDRTSVRSTRIEAALRAEIGSCSEVVDRRQSDRSAGAILRLDDRCERQQEERRNKCKRATA